MTRVTTVFFDFGGTLVEPLRGADDMWRDVARLVGLQIDPDSLVQAQREADFRFRAELYDYHGRMREFWRLYDGFILERVGLASPSGSPAAAIEELGDRIDRAFKRMLLSRPFPETREILAALRAKGLRLGIVSNATEDLVDRLAALGLAGNFDTVTYSQEARAEKPDPAIFRLALQRAGCAPTEAVHIGDRMDADVVGARAAGITPILVDRHDRAREADCLRVSDLRELPVLLETALR